jgi:hypothetical protein
MRFKADCCNSCSLFLVIAELSAGVRELRLFRMPKLTIKNLDRHWAWTSSSFRAEHQPWLKLFDEALTQTSYVMSELEGKRQLAENCSYLLLSKAVNHILSMWTLANRGLNVDASLCARNSVETLLLLQICLLDPEEQFFRQWAEGRGFSPAWVRKQLDSIKRVQVREIEYSRSADEDGLDALIYGWLSKITHANVESLSYSVRGRGENSFQVIVGGNTTGEGPMIDALFAICLSKLALTEVLCIRFVTRLVWRIEKSN